MFTIHLHQKIYVQFVYVHFKINVFYYHVIISSISIVSKNGFLLIIHVLYVEQKLIII